MLVRARFRSLSWSVILPSPAILGYGFGLSELMLFILKRSKADEAPVDRGSLRILWITILLSIAASGTIAVVLPSYRLPVTVYPYGVALFAAGLALRWYAIIYLGRFFTVNVSIQDGHRVVDSGPYRHIRHPSYAGVLLALIGYGLCQRNGIAVPVLGALKLNLYRLA